VIETIRAHWNTFWFKETSPAPLCLFRILFGILLLCAGVLILPETITWFGDKGLLSWNAAQAYTGTARFSLLNIFGASDAVLYVLLTIYMIASLGLCLGFKPRICAAVVFLILTTLHHRNPAVMNSGDTLMRIFAFMLIFAPSGAMYAIGSRKKASAGSESPKVQRWAQRLMQFQITAVYAQTLLGKLDGEMWRNGTALYYSSRLEELYRLPVPILFDNIYTIKLFTWGTLFAEALLCTLIWSKPPLRYYVLGLGVLLHLGIEWSMNIPLFEWLMICSFVLFIEPNHVEAAVNRISRLFGWKKKQEEPSASMP